MKTNTKDKVNEYVDKFLNNPTVENYKSLNIYLKRYYRELNRTKS